MKNIILLFALIISLSACKKQEVKPETWYLDFAVPALNIRYGNLPVQRIADNMGADGEKVGLCLDFEAESFTARLFTYGDSVYQVNGVIDGNPFVVLDGKMNICGGQQGIECNYKIEIR